MLVRRFSLFLLFLALAACDATAVPEIVPTGTPARSRIGSRPHRNALTRSPGRHSTHAFANRTHTSRRSSGGADPRTNGDTPRHG